MFHTVWHIYDRIFKRIFSLSDIAIINLINGLFGKDFPTNSDVAYFNRNFTRCDLKDRPADVFVTIAEKHTFHLEAQTTADDLIVLRVFEYSFLYAMSVQKNPDVLHFPEPIVVYLNHLENIPAESILHISFGSQGSFDYRVKNFLYLNHDVAELNRRKMAVLIPFQVMRLRSFLETRHSGRNSRKTDFNPDKFSRLQDEIRHDIIESIETNRHLGNITIDDAKQLFELTDFLDKHIRKEFSQKMKGAKEHMKPLLPGAIELPNDKYRFKIDVLERQNARYAAENAKYADENARYANENARYADENARYADEILKLKKQIAELKANQYKS